MTAFNPVPGMQSSPRNGRTVGWLDCVLLCLLACSFLSLVIGVTAPILQVQKRVVFSVIGLRFPVLDVKNEVTIVGAIHDLCISNGLVLGIIILTASIILPGTKMIAVGIVWSQWRCRGWRSDKALRALSIASKWSLTEPVVLGITVVACKLSDDLKVTLTYGSAFFLISIFGSILATEVVKRTVIHSRN